jgi:hypothetical protein
MSALKNLRHEAFARARFRGLTVPEAYREAGYAGKGDHNCTVMNRRADVRARVAELHQEVADALAYEKLDAVKDLVAIIRALPSEACKGHPLAEGRWSRTGRFYRFPDKLEALAQLIRLMGWDEPVKVEASATVSAERPRDTMIELLEEVRKPKPPVKFWPVNWEPAQGAENEEEEEENDKLQSTNHNEVGDKGG